MSNSNYINKNFKSAILESVSSSMMKSWDFDTNYYNEMNVNTKIKNNKYFSVVFKYDGKSKIIHWELNEIKDTNMNFISEGKIIGLDIENLKSECNKINKLTKMV